MWTQLLVRYAHALHHARPKVLDDDVDIAREAHEDFASFRLRRIHADRALSHIRHKAEGRVSVDCATDRARPIALRRLDLDYVGTAAREDAAAVRAGKPLTHIENADAAVRLRCVGRVTVHPITSRLAYRVVSCG